MPPILASKPPAAPLPTPPPSLRGERVTRGAVLPPPSVHIRVIHTSPTHMVHTSYTPLPHPHTLRRLTSGCGLLCRGPRRRRHRHAADLLPAPARLGRRHPAAASGRGAQRRQSAAEGAEGRCHPNAALGGCRPPPSTPPSTSPSAHTTLLDRRRHHLMLCNVTLPGVVSSHPSVDRCVSALYPRLLADWLLRQEGTDLEREEGPRRYCCHRWPSRYTRCNSKEGDEQRGGEGMEGRPDGGV